MSQTEPTAPAFASHAPNTNVLIRACAIAPAHIAQGSSVTTIVWPSKRQELFAIAAWRSAMISACALGSLSISRRLNQVPTCLPSAFKTSAPTGTSPVASADLAISTAAFISCSKELEANDNV